MARRKAQDPRPTLVAYGAPLMVRPAREMPLEEAVVEALDTARVDPTVFLSLPVVLVKNERSLDVEELLDRARASGLQTELGMLLDLTAELSEQTRFRSLAKRLAPNKGEPRYYPEPRGGKYGRVLADARTPAVVARWGFRMNTTQRDLRGFLRKHLG